MLVSVYIPPMIRLKRAAYITHIHEQRAHAMLIGYISAREQVLCVCALMISACVGESESEKRISN